MSNLHDQVAHKLVQQITLWFVYGLKTPVVLLLFSIKTALMLEEALLQSGEHLIVIWASLSCYHDKKNPTTLC